MRLQLLLLPCLLFSPVLRAEPLLVCGMDEVFVVDSTAPTKSPIKKLWSWRAREHPELPEAVQKAFATTDDCKLFNDRVLISSSSGGCALVDYPAGHVIWHAVVPNAHSIEWLPGNLFAVAQSTGGKGNRLLLFDLIHGSEPVWEAALPSAHGVVWDRKRKRLWALGFKELRCYELHNGDTEAPSLVLQNSDALPDEDGHDLQAVPQSAELSVTTAHHVYLFDRDKREFRLHPLLGDRAHVKSVGVHPKTGQTVFTQASDSAWWTDHLHFLSPDADVLLAKEHLYKARWMTEPLEATMKPEARDAVERLDQFAKAGTRDHPRKLVFVYFIPADREPPPDYRRRLGRVMSHIGDFFGHEMERHGLGGRGIHFDLDDQGALKVHEVKGKRSAADYLGRDPRKGYDIKAEARPVLAAAGIDDEKETVIYFCHLRTERDGHITGIGPYYGSGAQPGPFRWGRCWFTDATILDSDRLSDSTLMLDDEEYGRISAGRYNSIFIGGAAHELGHGLGLPHDKERLDEAASGTSLMGSGNRTYGEEKRGEGKGSFLTLADALRLASHPMFSGTDRDWSVRQECVLTELRASTAAGHLSISGRISATPEPYALIAYLDPIAGEIVDAKGWHDYESTTWTARLDASNHFMVSISGFKPGNAHIRLVVCHVNGSTSSHRYPLKVEKDGTPGVPDFGQPLGSQ